MKETREGLGFRLSSKRLPKQATQRANRFLNRLFGFDTFNEIFRALPECSDSQLMQTVLDAMNVRVERAGAPLEAIPRSGPLVVVCQNENVRGFLGLTGLDSVLAIHVTLAKALSATPSG